MFESQKIYVNARALIVRQNDGVTELLLQTRNKMGQRRTKELPGGQVEPFESFYDALKREIKEETGLTITSVRDQEARFETDNSGKRVECFQPYAVYQTLEGPVDSMGVFFLCEAEGGLLELGDDTLAIGWTTLEHIQTLLNDDAHQFSWVDEAALRLFLRRGLES